MAEAVLKPIDRDLPEAVNVTLEEWNGIYDLLAERDPTNQDRDVFALTGRFHDPNAPDDPPLRANFDSSKCRMLEGMDVDQTCDIDSTIALAFETLPIRNEANLNLFILPDVRYTLNADYHIPGVVVDDGRAQQEVPIHKIPNARIGEVGKHLVRIHCPGLCHNEDLARQKNSNYIPEAYMRTLYDQGWLPALQQVLPPQHLRVMPPRFDAEAFRAKQGNDDEREGPRTFQQSAKPIPGRYVREVIRVLRARVEAVQELEWARDFFLVVEGKDFKFDDAARHLAPEQVIEDVDAANPQDPRGVAISAVLSEFHVEELVQGRGRLYCDIATTVSASRPPFVDEEEDEMRSVSVFPNAQFHAQIISHFTGKPINECERWVESSGGPYSKDEEALLGDPAGARLVIRIPGPNGVVYFQVYVTSKYITYNVVLKKKARRTSPQKCESNWAVERASYFIPIQEAFRTAAGTHSVAVRFESRVPYASYGHVHLAIPAALLAQWLLWMDDEVFWGYKFRRVKSIGNVLHRFMTSPQRINIVSHHILEYASLVVILIWMANALVNRPDDGGHWDEVRHSASIHGLVNGEVVPVQDLTQFNMQVLHYDNPPRVSSQRTISQQTLTYLFSHDRRLSFTMLVYKIQGRGTKATTKVGPPRFETITEDIWHLQDPVERMTAGRELLPVPRRGNRQRIVSYEAPDDAPNMFENVFQEIQQQEQARFPSEEHDPEQREVPPIDRRLSDLLHKLARQIIAKAPNKQKTDESWCMLDAFDASFDTFRDANLPSTIFSSWTHCGNRPERWNGTVHAYLPDLEGHKDIEEKAASGNSQGLHCLEAWKEWALLLGEFDEGARKDIIKQGRKLINTQWRWVPWFNSNHLWKTGSVGKGTSGKKPMGEKQGGPMIIFNPAFRPPPSS